MEAEFAALFHFKNMKKLKLKLLHMMLIFHILSEHYKFKCGLKMSKTMYIGRKSG